MSSTRSRLLVAVLAVLLGTTLVAGTSYAAPLTVKKVKKIAAKVVQNQAPNLSVKNAKTADRAKDANNSDDSAKLDGRSPAVYLDRAAFGEAKGPTVLALVDEYQLLNPVSLTVPQGVRYVHVTGSATMIGGDAGTDNYGMWIEVDSNVCVNAGNDFDFRQLGNTEDFQDSVTVDRTLALPPGSHTFRMCVQTGSTNMSAGARSMSVETVATNSLGN